MTTQQAAGQPLLTLPFCFPNHKYKIFKFFMNRYTKTKHENLMMNLRTIVVCNGDASD